MSAEPKSNANDINLQTLTQLAQVQGQLTALTQLIHHQHEGTNRRIEDFRAHVEQRMGGMDRRLETLEHNERGTALRTAGVAATTALVTSTVVAAGLRLLKP